MKIDNSGCGTLTYIGIALTLLSMAIVILLHYRKSKFCRGHRFSNVVKIVLFISDVQHYIPIKPCKTSVCFHLFKITGTLTSEDIRLNQNYLFFRCKLPVEVVDIEVKVTSGDAHFQKG